MPGDALHLLIGAGPLGLAVAKALREAGLHYDHVEATDHVGGNWAHGVYQTAHIISSKHTTEFPDWPMPPDYPDFPSAAQMRTYFEGFTAAHELQTSIRFKKTVTKVRPRPDQRWDVAFEDGETGIYTGVIVCNGHHWARDFPPWADPHNSVVMHSKDYQRPEQLVGKRVLVVGGGNSGCDIISEAARVATTAEWSLRRGYWFLPKTVLGRPSVELMHPLAPIFVQRLVLRLVLRLVVGPYAAYGLPEPDHRLFEAHPSVSTEALHYLKHGRITVRPDVASFQGKTVTFTDGTTQDYDRIVCATGYHLRFPFLPEGLVPVHGKVAQLYGGLVRPDARHLYIVGTAQARYGIGPLIRPYAQLVARWIRLQDQLSVNLGQVLVRLGQTPPSDHLVDPHKAIRSMWLSRVLWERILLRLGRRMSVADEPAPSTSSG